VLLVGALLWSAPNAAKVLDLVRDDDIDSPTLAAVLDAVRRLSEEAGSWPEAAEDWQWCARFGYQVIERRGTGGGAFRLMYSRFLEEAGRPEAALAAEAAGRWTALAGALHAASESDEPEVGLWRAVDAAAREVHEAERRLWTSLAG